MIDQTRQIRFTGDPTAPGLLEVLNRGRTRPLEIELRNHQGEKILRARVHVVLADVTSDSLALELDAAAVVVCPPAVGRDCVERPPTLAELPYDRAALDFHCHRGRPRNRERDAMLARDREVRRLFDLGVTAKELAARIGTTPRAVYSIVGER
jgi:hypothetical protein